MRISDVATRSTVCMQPPLHALAVEVSVSVSVLLQPCDPFSLHALPSELMNEIDYLLAATKATLLSLPHALPPVGISVTAAVAELRT
jgi:hypothetical protein